MMDNHEGPMLALLFSLGGGPEKLVRQRVGSEQKKKDEDGKDNGHETDRCKSSGSTRNFETSRFMTRPGSKKAIHGRKQKMPKMIKKHKIF